MEKTQQPYVYECELSYFWFDENDFLFFRSKDVVQTLQKQKKTFEMLKNMGCHNKSMLLDLTGCSLLMYDEKTKEYLAWTLPLLFNAVAVVAKTTLQKVAPTIFLNTMDLSIPMRIFDTEEEAREWLKQFD
jgi:hypothetical protein